MVGGGGLKKNIVWTSSICWRIGFIRIFRVAFVRLLYVRLRKGKLLPHIFLKIGPAGFKLPTGARNRRNATMKI